MKALPQLQFLVLSNMIFSLHAVRERRSEGPMHRFQPRLLGDSKCGGLWSDITRRGARRGAAVRRTVLDRTATLRAVLDPDVQLEINRPSACRDRQVGACRVEAYRYPGAPPTLRLQGHPRLRTQYLQPAFRRDGGSRAVSPPAARGFTTGRCLLFQHPIATSQYAPPHSIPSLHHVGVAESDQGVPAC